MHETLFSELGGRDGIEAVVALFYAHVLRDPELSAFFRGVAMTRLHQLQTDFFCSVLGGTPWKGRDLKTAHAGLRIHQHHFDRVAIHLAAALEQSKVKGAHIRQILDLVGTLRAQIVTVPGK